VTTQSGASGEPNPPGGSEQTEALTEERVTALFNDLFNKSFKARSEQLEKKLTKTLEDSIGKLSEGLVEKLKEQTPATPAPGEEGKPKSTDPKESAEYRGLLKRLADMEEREKQRVAELESERAKVRDKELRGALGEVLNKHGVTGIYNDNAIGRLVDSKKLVAYDEDGSIVFKDGDGVLDLESGVKSWVASEEGKLYTPPRNANGSGDGPRGATRAPVGAPKNGVAPSKADIARGLLKNIVPGQQT
jgi:hypothetical protein